MISKDFIVDAFCALCEKHEDLKNILEKEYIYDYLKMLKSPFAIKSNGDLVEVNKESLFKFLLNYSNDSDYQEFLLNSISQENINNLSGKNKSYLINDLLLNRINIESIEVLFENGFKLEEKYTIDAMEIDFALLGYTDYFKLAEKYNTLDFTKKYQDTYTPNEFTIDEYLDEVQDFKEETYNFIKNTRLKQELEKNLSNKEIKKQPKI